MCVLRVAGDDFEIDALLESSDLAPCHVQRKGLPRFESGRSIAEYTGFNVEVSSDDGEDLERQVADAIEFLTANRTAIRRVLEFPGVDYAYLDFNVNCCLGNGVAIQNSRISSDLLKLAGDLRLDINISLYPGPHTPL